MAKMHATGITHCLVYSAVFGLYALSFLHDIFVLSEVKARRPDLLTPSFGGRIKFLTYIDLLLQNFFFFLCTINALFEFYTKKRDLDSKLRKACNFIFTSLAFPIGCMVTLMFWGLFFLNRDLIYPQVFDEIIPSWQNHIMHTLPLIGVLIECFITEHFYDKSFIKTFLPTVFFSLAYLIWIFIIAYVGGFWVYPIFAVLSPFYRGLFILGSLLVGCVFCKSGQVLNELIWRKSAKKNLKKKN